MGIGDTPEGPRIPVPGYRDTPRGFIEQVSVTGLLIIDLPLELGFAAQRNIVISY